MQAIAEQISPAPLRRLAWAALFAGSLGAALAVDAGAWQLWVLLVAPDIALFAGIGRGLEKKQLHPRAVPLYNALHHPAGPVVLGLASIALGSRLARRSPRLARPHRHRSGGRLRASRRAWLHWPLTAGRTS